MFPALAAALVGALAAGTATAMAGASASPLGEGFGNLAAPAPVPPGVLTRPNPPVDTSDDPTTTDPTYDAPDTTDEPTPGTTTPPSSSKPPAPPTTTNPPSTPDKPKPAVDLVIDMVNAERAKAGCPALRDNPHLRLAAQLHSADMSNRNYFDHTTPDGVTFAERIVSAGYPNPGAENIAKGQQSAEDVMAAWMASDTHRANILDCDLASIGVGLETQGWYWTQDFGR